MPDSENAAVGPAIVVELNFNLIQVLRLVHALVEAGCRLHVSPKDTQKLVQLRRIFGMPYKTGTESAPTLHGLSIDHMQPETRVGMIARPLIFPLAAFTYCRNRWPPARRVRAAFPGKPTASRRAAIDAWFELSGLKLRVPNDTSSRPDSFLHRLSANTARRLRMPQRNHVFSEGVKIVLSEEGRVFPRKAWNVDYYAALLESEFVLCPDGDAGKDGVAWTYRFFESILCGAIPVVQNVSRAYDGFRFRRMEEPLGRLFWSRDDAAFNFDLAMKLLTVPKNELRAEVRRLLESRDSTVDKPAPQAQGGS